jgi:hypothetical protein
MVEKQLLLKILKTIIRLNNRPLSLLLQQEILLKFMNVLLELQKTLIRSGFKLDHEQLLIYPDFIGCHRMFIANATNILSVSGRAMYSFAFSEFC